MVSNSLNRLTYVMPQFVIIMRVSKIKKINKTDGYLATFNSVCFFISDDLKLPGCNDKGTKRNRSISIEVFASKFNGVSNYRALKTPTVSIFK